MDYIADLGLPLLLLDPLIWELGSEFVWLSLVQTGARVFLNQKFANLLQKAPRHTFLTTAALAPLPLTEVDIVKETILDLGETAVVPDPARQMVGFQAWPFDFSELRDCSHFCAPAWFPQ